MTTGRRTTASQVLDKATDSFVKALASDSRQRIMALLTDGACLTVNEITRRCGLSQPGTSEQLAILRRAGLVTATRSGNYVHYRADATTIAACLTTLRAYLEPRPTSAPAEQTGVDALGGRGLAHRASAIHEAEFHDDRPVDAGSGREVLNSLWTPDPDRNREQATMLAAADRSDLDAQGGDANQSAEGPSDPVPAIRDLEGTLIQVTAFARLDPAVVDLALAEEVLRDVIPDGNSPELTADQIIDATSEYYGVSMDDLRRRSRFRAHVNARQVAMYLCRELTDLSLPQIGQALGGRDHTTVMHANHKIRQQMAERRTLFNQITELTNIIKDR